MPLTEDTHFSDVCQKPCFRTGNRTQKSLLVAASRAAKQLVGYFCGYTFQSQPVGRKMLRAAFESLNYVEAGLRDKTLGQVWHRVTHRVLQDVQHKSYGMKVTLANGCDF